MVVLDANHTREAKVDRRVMGATFREIEALVQMFNSRRRGD